MWYVDNYHPTLSPFLFHPANGKWRSPKEALDLKLEGVRKGLPDYLFLKRNRYYQGFCLEFKVDTKVRMEQEFYLNLLKDEGWYVNVAYSWQDAASWFEDYVCNIAGYRESGGTSKERSIQNAPGKNCRKRSYRLKKSERSNNRNDVA